jgi:hypothetical protein
MELLQSDHPSCSVMAHDSCSHGYSAFSRSSDHDGLANQHDTDPLDSLQRALKAVTTSIKSSKQTTKALAGAVVGLRGSAAHDALVADGSMAVKNLQRALHNVSKAQRIVADISNPPDDTPAEAESESGTFDESSTGIAESSMPFIRFLEIQNVLINGYDYRKFIYFTCSDVFSTVYFILVNAKLCTSLFRRLEYLVCKGRGGTVGRG